MIIPQNVRARLFRLNSRERQRINSKASGFRGTPRRLARAELQWMMKTLVQYQYAYLIDNSPKYGKLWEAFINGVQWLFVEVKNSSPERDGSYRTYYLRVHPRLRPLGRPNGQAMADGQTRTARAAVASTFGLYEHEYHPDVET